MPQIRRILFPVDFSASCLAAARYVEAFAGQFDAEVMLLHVVGMGEHALPQELLPSRREQLDAFLANELKYFTTTRVCVTGDASSEIVRAATEWTPDLVMVPTHGLGTFRRFLIGSVTAKLLYDLDCPVWTSAHLAQAPELEDIHCRRVLCAVDLTERSECVLEWAAWLAGQYQATLGMVHATAKEPVAHYGWRSEDEFAQSVSEDTTRRIDYLQKKAGTAAEVFVHTGNPGKVVAQAARDFKADLVVAGRHSGADTDFRQNTYDILCDCPCPVVSI